jgi:hypothetical protein
MTAVRKLDIRFLKEVLIGLLAEITGIAAADFVHDFLSMFLAKEPLKHSSHRRPKVAAFMPQNWFL